MKDLPSQPPTLEIVFEAVSGDSAATRRLEPTYAASSEPSSRESDGLPALRRGECIRFSVRSPISGRLHFFDFGTDGEVHHLLPSERIPDPVVEAGEWVSLPGSFGMAGPWWRVAPDTRPSGETGLPEGFVFVVVRTNLADGGGDGNAASLFSEFAGLPSGDWAWGCAESEILP